MNVVGTQNVLASASSCTRTGEQRVSKSMKGRVEELERELAGANAALRRFEARLADYEEHSPDMFVSVDAKTGTIRSCNATVTRTLGFDLDEIVGQPVFCLYDPRCALEVKLAFEQFVETGRVNNAELSIMRKDGSTIPVLLSVVGVRDASNNMEHSVSILRDISNLKHLETLEVLNADLERSNQELEQFAYVVSHDLQEPLRMVSSFTSLIARELEGKTDERLDSFLGFAQDGAARMRGLIRDLLEYSRVGREDQREAVDLNTILSQVQVDLGLLTTERNATIEVAPLPTLTCDPTQMRQLFQNLVGNGVKFCRADRAPIVKIVAHREQSGWRIGVIDNGVGIAPEHRVRVFRVFQRLHKRGVYEGSGIGLAIAKKLVEQHYGRIWVEDSEGGGCAFWFTWPDGAMASGSNG